MHSGNAGNEVETVGQKWHHYASEFDPFKCHKRRYAPWYRVLTECKGSVQQAGSWEGN